MFPRCAVDTVGYINELQLYYQEQVEPVQTDRYSYSTQVTYQTNFPHCHLCHLDRLSGDVNTPPPLPYI